MPRPATQPPVAPKPQEGPRLPTGRDLGISLWPGNYDISKPYAGHPAHPDVLPPNSVQYRPTIRSTAVRTLSVCRRRYALSERYGLRHKALVRKALHRGTVVHRHIELVLKKTPDAEIDPALDALYDEFWEKEILPNINKGGLLPDGTPVDEVREDTRMDHLKAKGMARAFVAKYDLYPDQWEIIGCECLITAKMPGFKLPIRCKLDLAIRNRSTRRIWIWDVKTTADPPLSVVAAAPLDIQTTINRIGAMAQWPDDIIEGFCHNVLRTPGIKFCDPTYTFAAVKPGAKRATRVFDTEAELQEWIGLNPGAWSVERRVTGDKDIEAYAERIAEWYRVREELAEMGDKEQIYRLSLERPVVQSRYYFGRDFPATHMRLLEEADRAGRLRIDLLNRFPDCGNMYTCLHADGRRACAYLPLCSTPRMDNWPSVVLNRFDQSHRDSETEEI
jgi:hypothetical protein